MNDIDQIRSIAEFDRWYIDTNGMCHKDCDVRFQDSLPDYLTSLDAIVPVTEKLEPEQQVNFVLELEQMIRRPENVAFGDKPSKKFPFNEFGRWSCINATARQRCEALLRTIGKFQETKP